MQGNVRAISGTKSLGALVTVCSEGSLTIISRIAQIATSDDGEPGAGSRRDASGTRCSDSRMAPFQAAEPATGVIARAGDHAGVER